MRARATGLILFSAVLASCQQTVRPFLAKYCLSCHNDKIRTANLSLAGTLSRRDWAKVLDKLASGKMPPPGMPAPAPSEIASMSAWIREMYSLDAPRTESDPGRVTARRLNRTEYNNTIRDLLGVSLHAADEFPLDDSGYGFDNIGDVLSLSPLLMEKYIAAARRISHEAVYGGSYPAHPAKLIRLLVKKSQDDSTTGDNILPFSMRGAMYGSFQLPVDAEYEFRLRLANYRARAGVSNTKALGDEERKAYLEASRKAYPPVTMVFKIDGRQVLTDVVEGSIDYQYSRTESSVRLRLPAGEHEFRASYPELADLADPRGNLNRDGRRKLYVEYLDILGPYQPNAGPPESYKHLLICGHLDGNHQPGCERRILGTVARRAYRRPPTERELDELTGLFSLVRKDGESFEEGIRVALQAILLSPNFLFRIERDPASPAPAYWVSDYELASRLAYFLWSSMPDDTLLNAADRHALRSAGALEDQVRRMLADPKASALVENFAGQWLNLRMLDHRRPDPSRFPTVDDELVDAMRRETNLFTGAMVSEDRSVLDFLDGGFTFVNGPLARHYGIAGVNGEDFKRVPLDGEQRSGVMTQGSVLTLSSYATRTSPVLRGKWVLETMLGAPPPAPPPGVPPLEESDIGSVASMRQRMEQHRANAACAVCHNQMDPIGFALENYTASGAWRTHDGKFPIDSSGSLPGGQSFSGPRGLKTILRARPDTFTRNLTGKLLTYALGRGLESFDRGAVEQISGSVAASGYRFSSLILGIVESEPFQMRKREGDQP